MTSREELDAKLAEKGYSHPEEINTYRPQTTYMAYSKGDYTSQVYDPYATFNTEEPESKSVQKTARCPVCEKQAMYSCSCVLEDMLCGNAHTWYVLKSGQVIIANPHEDEDD